MQGIQKKKKKNPLFHESHLMPKQAVFIWQVKHTPLFWTENAFTLSLPAFYFLSLLWCLHLSTYPLLPVQTHCFTALSSKCLELYRQNISRFDKEIALFRQGHVQVTAYSVIMVSPTFPSLEPLISNDTLLTKKKEMKMTCSGWALSEGLFSQDPPWGHMDVTKAFQIRGPTLSRYRGSAEKFFSKHLWARRERTPRSWRMSPVPQLLSLFGFQGVGLRLDNRSRACPVTRPSCTRSPCFAFSLPTLSFVSLLWPWLINLISSGDTHL